MTKCGDLDVRYFKFIGFWQYINEWPNTSRSDFFSLSLGVLFSIFISVQILNSILGGYGFDEITEKVSVNLTCFESAVKMTYYCWKREQIGRLTDSFSQEFLTCSKYDAERTEIILGKNANRVNGATRGFVFMIFSTVALWNSLPIFRCIFGGCSSWQIMPTWYPWSVTGFTFNAATYIFEFFIMIYCASLLCNVNCLFFAFAMTTGAQFDLLNERLVSLDSTASKNASNSGQEDKQKLVCQLLDECLIDHQRLLRVTKELEDVYNPLFLFQMLTSTLTICLVLVQLNNHLSSDEDLPVAVIGKYLTYLVFGSVELFVYSWGGQVIQDKSGSTSAALYGFNWTDVPIKAQKNLLIALMRSRKPESLTAGKFYDVNFESFTKVMKASYSGFTVLHHGGN